MPFAMLIDITRCVNCRGCVYACKESNGLPKDAGVETLSPETWAVVERRRGLNVRRQCMHCVDPACVSVCPVAALQKQPEGPVTYDEDRCMGCRYCMVACPFQVPKYEWDEALPRVQKCIFCFDTRLKQGQKPACASVCPTGATVFGEREALVKDAQERIKNAPDDYVPEIYGLHEAGGTSVLYLSSIPFGKLGFPTGIEKQAYPKLTWKVLSMLPNVVGVGGVALFGTWWLINRRMEAEVRSSRLGQVASPDNKETHRE